MIVRDLIIELLDCDMDADVSIEIDTDEESIDTENYYIDSTRIKGREYVSLKHETSDQVLIEKGELHALKERIEELEELTNE
ncbi:hypothetical protein ACW2QC_07645 [Virgibacillus sp. FSP13]